MQRVSELLSTPYAKSRNKKDLSAELEREIQAVFYELFGERMPLKHGGCTDCFQVGISRINVHFQTLKHEQMKNGKRQFSLRKDASIKHPALVDAITNDNCSDENAFAILRINKKAIGQFATFPLDWEAQMAGAEPEAKSNTGDSDAGDDSPETKDQLQSTPSQERQAQLEAKSKTALISFAKDQEYPEEEYKDLTKANLIAYLLEKAE